MEVHGLYVPMEILHAICYDVQAYRAMLAIPSFARSLTPNNRTDFMLAFGYYITMNMRDIVRYTKTLEISYADPTHNATIWYLHGLRHRIDGPAVEFLDSNMYCWYRKGKMHRDNGPALELPNGSKYWYHDGLLHRDDGPAIVDIYSGIVAHFRNGLPYVPD